MVNVELQLVGFQCFKTLFWAKILRGCFFIKIIKIGIFWKDADFAFIGSIQLNIIELVGN
jgi:hypothetical protein